MGCVHILHTKWIERDYTKKSLVQYAWMVFGEEKTFVKFQNTRKALNIQSVYSMYLITYKNASTSSTTT